MALNLIFLFSLLIVGVFPEAPPSPAHVIDIFTNYPNSAEAVRDYGRVRSNRLENQYAINTTNTDRIDSPEMEQLSKVTWVENLNTDNEPTHGKTLLADGRARLDIYQPSNNGQSDQRYFPTYSNDYGYNKPNWHDANNDDGHGNDILESEFGVFDSPSDVDDSYSVRPSGGDSMTSADSSLSSAVYYPTGALLAQTPAKPNHNLMDLGNLIDYMASTRPSFLTATTTTTTTTTHHHHPSNVRRRRNKTLANGGNGDRLDVNLNINTFKLPAGYEAHSVAIRPGEVTGDKLESDFGQIVATTYKRKGNVKRVPKPMQNGGHGGHVGNGGNGGAINFNHIGKLSSLGSKQKVTQLIRKHLTRMRNATQYNQKKSRKNRKQAANSGNSLEKDDRTLVDWFTNNNNDTQIETSVTLHEGSAEKLIGTTAHDYLRPLETIKNKTKLIANKFLSLFTVIQFANFKCQANSAVSQYEGTCYLASQCTQRGGTAMGLCAEGHGVCCVFRGTCGGSSAQNCSYFESPGYPNYFPLSAGVVTPSPIFSSTTRNPLTPDPRVRRVDRFHRPPPEGSRYVESSLGDDYGALYERRAYLADEYEWPAAESRQSENANALSCSFRVTKASNRVRQMRIDFIDLELTGPTAGNCVDERLIISGVGLTMTLPAICGYNTGQHVYVDVSNLSGPLQLSVLANQIQRKRYKIRICQYEDGCSGLMNCLQYYTGVTGVIQSFNYDQAASMSRSMPGYFNNLNYAICIRREPGYCTITYTNVGPNGVVYPFEVRNYDVDGSLSVPAGQAGAGVINCPQDYIVINGIRLCGDRLNDGSRIDDFSANAPVTDTSGGPIIIPVRTSATSTSRGFKLYYTQNLCTSTAGTGAGTPDPRS